MIATDLTLNDATQAAAYQLRPWTLQDVIADPHAIPFLLTPTLRRLDAQAQVAIAARDMHDAARETIHAVRYSIAQTLEIRRRLDKLAELTPPSPQDGAGAPDTPPVLSPAEQAVRLMAAALLIIQAPPDHPGDGGQKTPVYPRPTRPTPPAGASRPDFDF